MPGAVASTKTFQARINQPRAQVAGARFLPAAFLEGRDCRLKVLEHLEEQREAGFSKVIATPSCGLGGLMLHPGSCGPWT
jgi:hypothetical protein